MMNLELFFRKVLYIGNNIKYNYFQDFTNRCFMIRAKLILLFLAAFNVICLSAESVLNLPKPNSCVSDYANIFSIIEKQDLENKIIKFNNLSVAEVAVVTVGSLEGMTVSDFANKLALKWGIGKNYENKGILILIKPKYADEKGQVYIAVSFGLELNISKRSAQEIVDSILISNFKSNKYYEGVNSATARLFELSLVKSNISEAKVKFNYIFYLLVLLMIIISILISFRVYLLFLKNRKIPVKYSHFYVDGEYNSKSIIDQIKRIEKVHNCKYSKLKTQIANYEMHSIERIAVYEDLIDDRLFCILLNGRNRFFTFLEMSDLFLLLILSYLVILSIIVPISLWYYSGVGAFLLSLIVSLLCIYASIVIFIQVLKNYLSDYRKKGKYTGGLSVSLFALNSLFKRKIKRQYDPLTNSYIYIPPVAIASTSGGNDGGSSSGGGGGFGGGVGGSW
jgi:Beta-propeller domains of methanol dehydrogenase type